MANKEESWKRSPKEVKLEKPPESPGIRTGLADAVKIIKEEYPLLPQPFNQRSDFSKIVRIRELGLQEHAVKAVRQLENEGWLRKVKSQFIITGK